MKQYAIQVINEPSSLGCAGRSRGTQRIISDHDHELHRHIDQATEWRGTAEEGRKSVDSTSVGMPVIRRCAARRRKRSTTHVDTLQCDAAELVLDRKVWTRAATRAATLECLQKNGVTKPLKKKPKVAVKPAQPLPQVAPAPVPEPAHVDDPQTWVDIDAGDSDMLELCSEYVKDIYAYLMDLEVRQAVRPGYMKGYDITPRMRARLINWLIQVHSMLQLLQETQEETLYLTVAILDRFLQVQLISPAKLQLVGVTAMLLASKYESRVQRVRVQHFARLTDNAFTPAQIRRMEQVILRALNFELGSPLPLHFLRRACKATTTTMKTYVLAKYLMELTLLDYKMVHYRPSEISAASLCLSQKLLDGLPWTPTEKYYTTYDEAHLKPIMHQMVKNVIVANEGRTEFQAVRSKYSQSLQMEIALLPELQSPVLKSLAAPLLDTVYEVDCYNFMVVEVLPMVMGVEVLPMVMGVEDLPMVGMLSPAYEEKTKSPSWLEYFMNDCRS